MSIFIMSRLLCCVAYGLGAIQCLRRQEVVGRRSKKCSFLSTFRAKIVYVEVGRWSKKEPNFVQVEIEWPLASRSFDLRIVSFLKLF